LTLSTTGLFGAVAETVEIRRFAEFVWSRSELFEAVGLLESSGDRGDGCIVHALRVVSIAQSILLGF
jgi:hypothetical protein